MRLAVWCSTRVLSAILTLLGVSILIFAAMRFMPGGYAELVLGPFASASEKAALAARYGLDRSIVVQYWNWLGAAMRGDFGTSMVTHESVASELRMRLPVTFELTVMAAGAAVCLGVPLGAFTAVRARTGGGGALGRLTSGLGVSIPDFVLGSFVVYLFSRYALGLTVGGYVPFGQSPGTNLRAMVLPAAVLSVFAIAATARTTRDAVMGVLVEPYVTASVGRGESPGFILRHHVLRNAAIPIVIVTTTITAYLLGGAVIVESLFNLPGIGSYIVQAIGRRDYAVVQAGVLFAATVFIMMSVIVDVLVGVIDPRLTVTTKGRRA